MNNHPIAIALIAGSTHACVPYNGGTFVDRDGTFPGIAVVLGCIDLAINRVVDPNKVGSVLQYSFGNRCHRAVTIDLESVSVVARDDRGVLTRLVSYDPRHEIQPLDIGAGWSGRERIEYLAPFQADSDLRTAAICVDVAHIDRGNVSATREVCIGRPGMGDQ